MQNSLQSSEWIILSSFLVLFASLIAVAHVHEHRKVSHLEVYACGTEEPIAVTITGSVLKPGVYAVPFGARLGEAIKRSRPMRFANLRLFDFEQPVKVPTTLYIPELTTLSVRVEGAILDPKVLEMPVGSRLCDLKLKIHCSSKTDRKFLRRRRLLKDGETIVIPEIHS